MNSSVVENPGGAEILRFLRSARQVGWPQGVTPTTKPELPGFSDVLFADGEWSYHDLFGGTTVDVGFEVMYFRGAPVWGIAYRGGVIGAEPHPDHIFSFLIRALQAPNETNLPLRGPSVFLWEDWRYEYRIVGDVDSFLGVERIQYLGTICYERIQVGGRFGDGAQYGQPTALLDSIFAGPGGHQA